MKYVSVGRRFVALIVDAIIMGVVTAPFGNYQHVQTQYGSSYSFNYRGGAFLGLVAAWIVYYTIMEATLGGTAGKFALGIRVVQEDGSKCTWQGAIIRNLLRVIDAFPFYLIGAILVWTSPKRQRLGDRAGNTVVIIKGTNAGMGAGMGGAAAVAWPTQLPASGAVMPPPPPPPPVGPPGAGPGDQPIQ